jgi:hypothetical protein
VSPADPPSAFGADELRRSVTRPHAVLDIVLAERARLAATVLGRANLAPLTGLLLGTSVVFTVPFALVRAPAEPAHIAALFLGSTLICFPSLQVFSSYLGGRLTVAQNLVLALTVPAAAALFCLGFFPIQWFLEATMAPGGVGAHEIAIGLLSVALLLGISHLNRCLVADSALRGLRSSWLLLLGWQSLLVFITCRMALALRILQ